MVLTSQLLTTIRDNVKSLLQTRMTHMAGGTSTTTPTAADTILGGETFRNAIDSVDTTSQIREVTVTLLIDTTEANGETLAEFGTFNSAVANGGSLVHHNVLANVINKTSDISVLLDSTVVVNVIDDT